MNYNKYFALKRRNRNSYYNAVGGGKYGAGEIAVKTKTDVMKQILQEALAKKAAFDESSKKRKNQEENNHNV